MVVGKTKVNYYSRKETFSLAIITVVQHHHEIR